MANPITPSWSSPQGDPDGPLRVAGRGSGEPDFPAKALKPLKSYTKTSQILPKNSLALKEQKPFIPKARFFLKRGQSISIWFETLGYLNLIYTRFWPDYRPFRSFPSSQTSNPHYFELQIKLNRDQIVLKFLAKFRFFLKFISHHPTVNLGQYLYPIDSSWPGEHSGTLWESRRWSPQSWPVICRFHTYFSLIALSPLNFWYFSILPLSLKP